MADILTHGSLTTSLVSYWKLDETSGTREDIHSTNDLAVNGTGGVGSATGKINNAADLESSESDYLSIADASQTGLDLSTDWSFSCWIKFESLPSAGTLMSIVSKRVSAGGDGAYTLQIYNSAGTYYFRVTVYDSVLPGENLTGNCGTLTPSAGVWYHIVWTFTESSFTSQGFVDNASVGTYVHTGYDGTMNNSAGPVTIGASSNTPAELFDGLIDEMGVWSKKLSGTEITDLYASGAGLPYSSASAIVPSMASLGVGA